MSEKKKSLSRRSFLKGATTIGVAAAVSGNGLFVQKLDAKMKRVGIKEPPGLSVDQDLLPMANNLAETSMQGAYDAFNGAFEEFVKGNSSTMNSKTLLEKQGIRLRSPEANSAAKSFNAPASIIKVRKLQLKQKGWHTHTTGTTCGGCCVWHAHVTW